MVRKKEKKKEANRNGGAWTTWPSDFKDHPSVVSCSDSIRDEQAATTPSCDPGTLQWLRHGLNTVKRNERE